MVGKVESFPSSDLSLSRHHLHFQFGEVVRFVDRVQQIPRQIPLIHFRPRRLVLLLNVTPANIALMMRAILNMLSPKNSQLFLDINATSGHDISRNNLDSKSAKLECRDAKEGYVWA